MCLVIAAFVASLDLAALGFVRGRPQRTGRPGYNPADLLGLYLTGKLDNVIFDGLGTAATRFEFAPGSRSVSVILPVLDVASTCLTCRFRRSSDAGPY